MCALLIDRTSEMTSLCPFDPHDPRFPWVLLVAVLVAWICRIRAKDGRDDE